HGYPEDSTIFPGHREVYNGHSTRQPFYGNHYGNNYGDGRRTARRRLLPATPTGKGAAMICPYQERIIRTPRPAEHVHRSSTGSTTSWANTGPRRGRLLYAPLILVEEEGATRAGSAGMWDKKQGGGGVPTESHPPASEWYSEASVDGAGQPYRAYTTLRVPPQLSPHYREKRGSADSLVEAVLISEGLGLYAKDPKFVAFAKREIADACHMTIDEMESAASDLLNRGGSRERESFQSHADTGLVYSDEEPIRSHEEDELADEMTCVTSF
ncbi:hypothetical protein DNTS_018273, partial [Danionella cerebrum]